MSVFAASLAATLIAIATEAAFGYPSTLFRKIGHPVTWIGSLIAKLEARYNRPDLLFAQRKRRGICTLVAVITVSLLGSLVCVIGANALTSGAGFLAVGLLGSSLIAQRSLHDHVASVADGLAIGLEEGRAAVSQIVGRDPQTLDEAAVARAAIESLAENFSDGIVAPVVYFALAGLPGAAAYKAINTADSMIGHRSERYAAYGWAAARLDDWVNLPASRLAALFIASAALLVRGCRSVDAVRAVSRDARRHRSPNAGWPEAAMAGALGLRLAGPRVYGGIMVDDHWMGQGRAEAGIADIRRALVVFRVACCVQVALIAMLLAAVLQ